jgi:hypothetical protein
MFLSTRVFWFALVYMHTGLKIETEPSSQLCFIAGTSIYGRLEGASHSS